MYMYTVSGCVSRPPKECDLPTASLPETEVTTRISKRRESLSLILLSKKRLLLLGRALVLVLVARLRVTKPL